jgi:type IV fimbrial biogenesis protein FimT
MMEPFFKTGVVTFRHGKSRKELRAAPAGFTMVEMMVVLAIVIVIVLIASPSFSNIMASRSAKSGASELFTTLVRARSEAIARNANVTVSPISGNWQNGWQILSANSTVLDNRSSVKGVTVTGPASIVFRSSGRISGTTAPSFVFTATAVSNVYQCVSVGLNGRPYMKAASSC